jgi:hypothetical protein
VEQNEFPKEYLGKKIAQGILKNSNEIMNIIWEKAQVP